MTNQTEQLLNLDPANILISDNVRFGLKPYRIAELAEDIARQGGVHTPVEVVVNEGAGDADPEYVLVFGHYRHAAVSQLNKDGAGLTLPAIVRASGDITDRIKRQISENQERENLSPMDAAVAIKQLLDAGVSRTEIRQMFARPGGRKGIQMQPASNAWVNMMVSFLGLPKPIQNKIHDGSLTVSAAYELTKVPADKRQAVLERAEAERLAAIEREEKEEERLLKAETKAAESAGKVEEAKKAVAEAEQEVTATKALVTEKKAAEKTAVAAAKKLEDQKAAKQMVSDAKKEVAEAEKLHSKAVKALDTAKSKASKIEEIKGRIKKAAAEAAKKAPNQSDIKKAAQKEGVQTGKFAPLSRAEIIKVLGELVLPGVPPIVKAVSESFLSCFNGEIGDDQLWIALRKATGEYEEPAAPTKKGKK